MNKQDKLLQAICNDPDPDQPRLIYADWLDKKDPARAEFIRVQVELARFEAEASSSQAIYSLLARSCNQREMSWFDWNAIDAGVAKRITLRKREKYLWGRNRKRWKAAEATERMGISCRAMERGFYAAGTLQGASVLAKHANDLFKRIPIQRLEKDQLTVEQANVLVQSGTLARLRALEISGKPEVIRVLGESRDATSIRELNWRGMWEVDDVVQLLANSKNWRGLKSLEFRTGRASTRAAEALFDCAHLKSLTNLRIRGDFGAATIKKLAESRMTQLRDLDLSNSSLDDQCLQHIASSASLKRLRTLVLHTTPRTTDRGLAALLSSPNKKKLTVLDLEQNSIRRFDPKVMSATNAWNLRVLDLTSFLMKGANVSGLANCPAIRDLIWLGLSSHKLTDRVVTSLVESAGLRKLAVLDLRYCGLSNRGVKMLASWPAFAELRCLHLVGNDFGVQGAHALADSPYLRKVKHVCVSKEQIGSAGVAALRKRFRSAFATC